MTIRLHADEPRPGHRPHRAPVERVRDIIAARGLSAPRPETSAALDAAPTPTPSELRIPPLFRTARADHPQVAAWVQQLLTTAGSRQLGTGPSLLLAGPTGTGKTHQAYGAIRALLDGGVRMRWSATTASDLYAAARPGAGTDPERHFTAVVRSPLLLLDDLGAAKPSEWNEELTYRLVNHRYEQMLPTIVTSNVPVGMLRERVGDRVASRLAQMTRRVVLSGPDRRRTSSP